MVKPVELVRLRIKHLPNRRSRVIVFTPDPVDLGEVDQVEIRNKLKKSFEKRAILDDEVIDFYEPTKAYLTLIESKRIGKKNLLMDIVG